MPFGTEGLEDLTGLALSGGGFRATLFHLGAFWRLNELGYLAKLDRISSVSGGSITTGLLAVRWSEFQFTQGEVVNFQSLIVAPLRAFCGRAVDAPAIAEGALLPLLDVSDMIEREYRSLVGPATLQDLPDRPRFIFNSTNFMTGVDFRFSKPYAGDYRIGLIPRPTFPVALAITASSAFPPFLSPVIRNLDPNSFQQVAGADLFPNPEYRRRLVLTDGGVYDNLGLETVEKRCKTLLVSDAGAPFVPTPTPGTSYLTQPFRTLDVIMSQARALRVRRLLSDYISQVRRGSYWGIKTLIADYKLPDALPVSPDSTKYLSSLRTRLNSFSDEEQSRLINGGYALCDAALRKYVLSGGVPKPPQWPYPQYALDQPIAPSLTPEATVYPVTL